jgi:hypothetical protein
MKLNELWVIMETLKCLIVLTSNVHVYQERLCRSTLKNAVFVI